MHRDSLESKADRECIDNTNFLLSFFLDLNDHITSSDIQRNADRH